MHSNLKVPFFAKGATFPLCWLGILIFVSLLLPTHCFGRIYIDINAPSIRKFNIAIPDFKNLSRNNENPELVRDLPGVISNDLDCSGYFTPMDKEAFLADNDASSTLEDVRFKDWSVIGAELLLKGSYTCIGRNVEVEIRLFDVFWGRQILSKRALGDISSYRSLMHRLGNDIILALTGREGIFLTKLTFVGNASGHKEIYMCEYDGHGVQQITTDKSISLLPRWSPDGKKIMYNSYKDGGPLLYMKDVSSGTVKRISTRPGLNIGACWTPDGQRVALTLSNKGIPDIFIIDLNGKIIKQVTNHWGIDVSPTFSPDGNQIAFVSNRSGSPQIYLVDLISGREERLTFEGNYNTSPAWSSLNRIAFVSQDAGHYDIYTMDPNGGRLRRLTEDGGNNEDPCWSPDGRYITFSSDRKGRYHLYLMNANGLNQRRITFLKGDQTAPSWAP
ncbi:MAG: Tol-Pal system beta propeller repeat protein TolB [Pseudomonadota bacterium]